MITAPLKHVAQVRYGLGQPPPAADDGIPILRATNIERGKFNPDGLVFARLNDLPLARAPLLEVGEILVVRSGAYTGDSALVTEEWRGAAPGYDLRITPRTIDPRYLAYQLLSSRALDQIHLARTRAAQPHLNAEDLGGVEVALVPTSEQVAIADYLDAETRRVDDAISAIRRSIDLVVERRRALIAEVFVEPLRTGRGTTVRAIAIPLLGRQRSPEHASGPHMVRYLRAANVKDGRLDLDDVMEMNFTPAEQRIFGLRDGDVLITEGAGSLNAVGANAVWRGELEGTVCFQNTLVRLRPIAGSDRRYVAWWARFAYESGLLRSVAGGASIYHLGVETIRALPAWAPGHEVQASIADRLDREVGAMEDQIHLRGRQVDLLLERRQAIVTAAVTGQLEIPGVSA